MLLEVLTHVQMLPAKYPGAAEMGSELVHAVTKTKKGGPVVMTGKPISRDSEKVQYEVVWKG